MGYSAIVKLFLLYEGQVEQGVDEDDATWAIATGWLIAKDVVVTAGHCAYDWDHGFGRLKKVKAYIGYTGQQSIGKEEVEFQPGKVVVTTPEWIDTDGGDEQKDIAFIKLHTPFTKVEKFYDWKQTPMSQYSADIGVVGYPGDIVDDRGERGATMYQMFKHTNYNLQTSYRNMLQYAIDTNGGKSHCFWCLSTTMAKHIFSFWLSDWLIRKLRVPCILQPRVTTYSNWGARPRGPDV